MAVTGKQERNGVPGPEGENSSAAMPGPMPAVPMGAATSAGMAYGDQGRVVFDGGVPAGEVSFEWDFGLPINDVEGGGSG